MLKKDYDLVPCKLQLVCSTMLLTLCTLKPQITAISDIRIQQEGHFPSYIEPVNCNEQQRQSLSTATQRLPEDTSSPLPRI